MKSRPIILASLAAVLAFPVSVLRVQAQSTNAPVWVPSKPNLVTRLDRSENTPDGTATASGDIVSEVEKMVQAGAEPKVIQSFIENWPTPYSVTADQILHLHGKGASTDVLTTLIRRGAELQARTSPPSTNAPVVSYPEMATTNAPAYLYPYPSYPADTYSYLYPSLSYPLLPPYMTYRYWWPYSYSYYYSWPGYRYGYWGGYGPRFHYGYRYPGFSHGFRPGYGGRGFPPGGMGRGHR